MFSDLSRVVTEGSRGLGRRLDMQDEAYNTDSKTCVRAVLIGLRGLEWQDNVKR